MPLQSPCQSTLFLPGKVVAQVLEAMHGALHDSGGTQHDGEGTVITPCLPHMHSGSKQNCP